MGTGGLFLRKLRAKVADEPTGFVWVEQGKIAGSGYPASKAQVEWLVSAGIRSILTLTEAPLPSDWTKGLDVVTGHVAMRDHMPPTMDTMNEGVDFVLGQSSAGRPVVVHCLAGEGRTGCVLAAYLIRTRNLDGSQALALLRKLKPEFVEPSQEKAVFEYANTQSNKPS